MRDPVSVLVSFVCAVALARVIPLPEGGSRARIMWGIGFFFAFWTTAMAGRALGVLPLIIWLFPAAVGASYYGLALMGMGLRKKWQSGRASRMHQVVGGALAGLGIGVGLILLLLGAIARK